MVKFTFSRDFRLLKPKHFAFVFQKPKRAKTLHITILSRLNTRGHPRVGLSVAKKYIKQAHERNRIKRLIRESFRLHQYFLPEMDFVVIVQKSAADLDNHALVETLEQLWCRHCH